MKPLGHLIIASLSIVIFLGCQKKSEENTQIVGTPISTAKVTRLDTAYIEKSVGTIDTKNSPTINAEVNGQITKVLCEVGDKVSAGQILATIDASQYQNTKDMGISQVKLYESQLVNQKKTVARYEELLTQKFISEAKLDDLKTQQKNYEEQLSSAKAALRENERNIAKSVIKSPINGVVYARNISVGDFASIGKPLFSIVNSSLLVIKAPFPQGVGEKIKKGQIAYLYVGEQGRKLEGRLTQIRPYVSANGSSFEAIITIKNPDDWLVGSSINVEVVTNEHKNAMNVPENAVVLRPAGTVVYTVNGNSVKQKIVTIGNKQNGKIEITSGLIGNETVATDGAGLLTDGAKIIVKVAK